MIFSSRFLFGALTLFGVLSSSVDTVYAQAGATTIPPLSLDSALWIWTGEPAGIPGMRAFRKTLPEGRSRAVCVTFAIAADDTYTVWVNGVEIGDNIRKAGDPAGSAFRELDIYSVSLSHVKNVIAVNATNVVSVDGVILTGIVRYEDGSQTAFVTDASWLTAGNIPPPDKFQDVGYDDSRWAHAAVIGPVGTQPWGALHFAPFTGKACGQSDQGNSGPVIIPHIPFVCPILPPLADGAKSPYWDLRNQVDCEIQRLEEALFLCQRERQKLIDQLIILIKQFSILGGQDLCQLVQIHTDSEVHRI
ncbi:hypothetical protein J3R30DRAFT_3407605 [Lentinula aciculospora]|uniref:Uncharacterized protein n=1 Tax=Lentinula aciculospora TaxID=153920 RepID=A0A9W9A3G6_9AGAR|nr:hypothetical protein J3R30DRAFT_3407605 [Lentinula aciculospora]